MEDETTLITPAEQTMDTSESKSTKRFEIKKWSAVAIEC